MKKTLLTTVGIISLLAIIVGIIVATQMNKAALSILPGDTSASPVVMCYQYSNLAAPGLVDQATLRMSVTGTQVTGEYSNLPAEKDSMKGSFVGTADRIPGNALYKIAHVAWDVSAEGTRVTQDLSIRFSDQDATALFGEMVDKGDGTYGYKDPEHLTTGFIMARVDCSAIVPADATASISGIKGKLPAGSTPPPALASVVGTKWVWTKTVASDKKITTPKKTGAFSITLAADGKVSGTTDCNGFGGTYNPGSDGILTFGPFASTLMYCDGSQEAVFTESLSNVSRMTTDAQGNLALVLKGSGRTMYFTKASK